MGAQGGEVQSGLAETDVEEEVAVDVLEADVAVALVEEAEVAVLLAWEEEVSELADEVAEGTVVELVFVIGEVETDWEPDERE